MLRFVTRSVAQAHVLTNTARGNMNNISSCSVKSTYVALLVLIVTITLYAARPLWCVTWHPNAFFEPHRLYLPQQYILQPMVIPPVPPASMFTHLDRISWWKSAPLLRWFLLQRLFGCWRNSTVKRWWQIPSSVRSKKLAVDSSFSSADLVVIIATYFDINARSAEIEATIAANTIRAADFHAEITPGFGFRIQYSTSILLSFQWAPHLTPYSFFLLCDTGLFLCQSMPGLHFFSFAAVLKLP